MFVSMLKDLFQKDKFKLDKGNTMSSLLIVERYILESLGTQSLTVDELYEQTGLNKKFIKNILTGLVYKGILCQKEGAYSLNNDRKKEVFSKINNQESVKSELKELFATFVNEFYQNQQKDMSLHIKKVNLDSIEEKVLQSHLQNLKDFFSGLAQKKERKTSTQKIVMWGECGYLNLVNNSLIA